MKYLFYLLFAIVIISGCRKEEEPQGPVTYISGVVRDSAAGEPIPGARLTLGQLFRGDSGGATWTEFHHIKSFAANQKGEFSYTYSGTRENLAIQVEKIGYFMPEIPWYLDIRYHEQNNVTIEMEKAAVVNLRLKNVTNTIDSFRVEVSGWSVTDEDGDYPYDLHNYNEGAEKNFKLYANGKDSLVITGWHMNSHSSQPVYQSYLLTLPRQEYNFDVEY